MDTVVAPVSDGVEVLEGRVVAIHEGEVLEAYGDRMRIVLPSSHTGNTVCIVEMETPAHNGPPLHVHHRETEIFFIQSGRYEFFLDGQRHEAGPGAVVYGPPGIPHHFRALTEGCQMQVLCMPGGFDHFMVESAAAFGEGPPTPETLADLGSRYGIEFLPPVAR